METIMRCSRGQNGSFRQRADELPPRLGMVFAGSARGPGAPLQAEHKIIGKTAFLINQYLFESSRR